MEELFASICQKHIYKISGLLSGMVLILCFFISIDGFIAKGLLFGYRYLLYLSFELLWVIAWFLIKGYFPRNIPNKIGLIISIETEDEQVKLRQKNDFVKQIRSLIVDNGMNMINVVVLNDYQSESLSGVLDKVRLVQEKQTRNKKPTKDVDESNILKKWNKLSKRIKGHLYIWGTIIKRNENEPTYFLELNAIVKLKKVDKQIVNHFSKEMSLSFPMKTFVPEKNEFSGFKFAGEWTYLAARFILGNAAFISNDPFTAFKLHNGIKEQALPLKNISPGIQYIQEKIDTYLSDDLVFMAYNEYLNKDKINAINHLSEAIKFNSGNYNALLFASVIAFKDDKDISKALYYVKMASKVQKNSTWKYNEAFLLMYDNQIYKGFQIYENLSFITFENENLTVDQCIEFIKEVLKEEQNKKQFLFTLGFLYYNKKSNFDAALGFFEKFLFETESTEAYGYLKRKASKYIDEIKIKMEPIKKTG